MSMKEETVPQRIRNRALKSPEAAALQFRPTLREDFQTISFSQLWDTARCLGAAFSRLGIKSGDHVALISDNRKEWLYCDLALMGMGAVDVPRGSDSNGEEISYIIKHSDSKVAILENTAQLKKLMEFNKKLSGIKKIILIESDQDAPGLPAGCELHFLADLLGTEDLTARELEAFDTAVEEGRSDQTSTIIYTSGTTGAPKGVLLTQQSFVFQLERIYSHIPVKAGETMLSVLPIWHTFERICEYIVLNAGASIAYSKPVGTVMLKDLKVQNPQWFISVPRIWESIYDSILRKLKKAGGIKLAMFTFFRSVNETWSRMDNLMKNEVGALQPINEHLNRALAVAPWLTLYPFKKLGDLLVFGKLRALLGSRFIAGVSGGGALPAHVDYFFQAAGIKILEGYGLTETGPVLSVRKCSRPILRTIGEPLEGVEFKVIDKQGNALEPGNKGKLIIKSPQTMQGYYKNPEATASVLNDGWLDTGDLAIETWNNSALKIVGRAKETIVLSGGENVEPSGIEAQLVSSPLINNVMIVGQDQKFLGALICPELDALKEAVAGEGTEWMDEGELLKSATTRNIINQEIQSIISPKNGFKPFEKIIRFVVLEKTFEAGEEMTKTMKLKRSTISKMYKKEIEKLFKS